MVLWLTIFMLMTLVIFGEKLELHKHSRMYFWVSEEKGNSYNAFLFARFLEFLLSAKFQQFMKTDLFIFLGKKEGRNKEGRERGRKRKFGQLNITFPIAENKNNNYWFFILVYDQATFYNSLKLEEWNSSTTVTVKATMFYVSDESENLEQWKTTREINSQ